MKTSKTIATLMILIGSVFTAWASRDIAFPAILSILGLLGLQRRFTWDPPPKRRCLSPMLLLFLAVLFALHYNYVILDRRMASDQAAVVAWQTIARYFLASMILILFLGSPNRLPPSLGLYHVATVVSAGQVLLLNDLYLAFRLAEVLSVLLVIAYAAAGREPTDAPAPQRSGYRPAWVLSGLILLLAGNVGWVLSSTLYLHVEVLNYLPAWLWQEGVGMEGPLPGTAYVGFSDSGKLSSILSIKGELDATPVLSITCDSAPGYLRARTFEVYRQSEWHDLSYRDAVMPAQNTPFGAYLPGRRINLFRVGGDEPDESREMAVRHRSPVADAMFTPLGTLSVEAPLSLLMCDDDDVISPASARIGLSYRITFAAPPEARPPGGQHGLQMLGVAQVDPRIEQLAQKIFAGCDTTAEKIEAVVNHFRTNYTYSLGLKVPRDQDSVTYFLLEASTGYCEYFASGAAILLRLAGVPTRYVTGFLVTEKDGEAWVARNMDAHAWVEAWDRQRRQWTIVEATVQEGLDTALAQSDSTGETGGSLRLLIGRLRDSLYEYGLFGLLAWLFEFYGLFAVSLVPAVVLTAALWLVYRNWRAGRRRKPATVASPEVIALHRALARMDRKVTLAGLRRDLGETLHAFSQRLRAHDSGDGLWTGVSDWYLEYARTRYARTISADRVRELEQSARALRPAR